MVLVIAALRWSDPRAAVDPLSGRVSTDPYAGAAAPADRCALEVALRIAGDLGGRCLAVSVGPPAVEEMLRQAVAAGADDVLRVDGPAGDGAATAASLHAALAAQGLTPALVVCGDRSTERGTGSTPAYLAGALGAAQALGLTELTADGGGLRAVRRLDGGRRELLGVPLPAVCSVEPGTAVARRASLAAVLAARTRPVPSVSVCAAAVPAVRAGTVRAYRPRPRVLPPPEGEGPRERLLALTGAHTPPRTPPRLVTPGSPAEAARLLLGHLRERA
jgi:electron transfer flavoprotein beta subunit